ncbi:MAG TPA: hypothetical protein VI233_06365, partial [Puia sp.]
MNRQPLFFPGLLALYFLFLAYQILNSTYVSPDDAWTIWNSTSSHHYIYDHWLRQGRLFSGLLQTWLFRAAHTIAGLKFLRLLSLIGWIGCTVMLYRVLKRLQKRITLGDETVLLTIAYFAPAMFSLVYISWASCVEVSIPILLALAIGLVFYEKGARAWTIALFLVGAVVILFFYQTFYPLVLIPFYCEYLSRRDGRVTRPMWTALLPFFVGLGIYYILFRYSVATSHLPSDPRTALKFDPLDRIAIFFAPPMNQAFNTNALFNMRSVISQAVFPVVAAAWLGIEFFYRKGKTGVKLRYVLGLLAWWILGYLPVMASQETFGPYRTMLVLGLMVFMMLADIVMTLIKDARTKMAFVYGVTLIFLCWGGFVYYGYLAHPLSGEYSAVRARLMKRYTPHIKEVIFIRPDEYAFQSHFGVRPYKDELGQPATYKEWTPEPLVKQIVY